MSNKQLEANTVIILEKPIKTKTNGNNDRLNLDKNVYLKLDTFYKQREIYRKHC